MILQELYALYNRLLAAGEALPRRGTCEQRIAFRIVLTPEGKLVNIEDALATEQTQVGKKVKEKRVMRSMLIPGKAKPSGSGINPCFLCDNAAYLLGMTDESKSGAKGRERAQLAFEELRRRHLMYEQAVNSPAYSAVCRFLEHWNPAQGAAHLPGKDSYTGNGVFRIVGMGYAHEDTRVLEWWRNEGSAAWFGKSDEGASGYCLVTGQKSTLAELHEPTIKGVANAQSMGAKLVSYNQNAFESYGKTQSYNAPVSQEAAFGYCCALNYLLSRRQNRFLLGDTTSVFWTDAPADEAQEDELFLLAAFDPASVAAQNAALVAKIRNTFSDLAAGKPIRELNSKVRYFILGLAPNAARLSVRYFRQSTMGDLARRLQEHYRALQLQPQFDGDPAIITPGMILRETAREAKDIPPVYAGPLMRAILHGTPYPTAIATAILRRFTADRRINYIRCAYLKAWLTRNTPNLNLTPMSDPNNTQPGYVLGRIFAILQKTQEDALGKLNRSLRDAFYPSAAATPAAVFPRLFKMYNHHIAKLEGGLRTKREKEMQAAMGLINAIPAHLNLEQQGLFALGFYHQTQSFYTPSSKTDSSTDNNH